jgi:hypothetical protein
VAVLPLGDDAAGELAGNGLAASGLESMLQQFQGLLLSRHPVGDGEIVGATID